MATFFAYFDVGIVINVAIFVATLVFSQKIKDFFAGVPNGFRSAMTGVEAKAKADIQAAIADVFSKITPAPAPVVKPPAPPAA